MMEVGLFLRAEAEFTGQSALTLLLEGWEDDEDDDDGNDDAACVDIDNDVVCGWGRVAALV